MALVLLAMSALLLPVSLLHVDLQACIVKAAVLKRLLLDLATLAFHLEIFRVQKCPVQLVVSVTEATETSVREESLQLLLELHSVYLVTPDLPLTRPTVQHVQHVFLGDSPGSHELRPVTSVTRADIPIHQAIMCVCNALAVIMAILLD